MSKRLTSETINLLLREVEEEKCFYVNCGHVVKSLYELDKALEKMTDEQFNFHRNNEKNDFYNWVLQVVGDIKLANEFARCKTKDTAVKKVKQRLEYLEKKR
jgi:hypothetical protein